MNETLLKDLTTLRVGGVVKGSVFRCSTLKLLTQTLNELTENNQIWRLLSGGSNTLAPEMFEGTIIQPTLKGIEVQKEDHNTVTVEVAAGEIWDEVVAYAVKQGWWGIENLSAIPGWAGAAPFQNIGAYGVEIADVIESVQVYDVAQKKVVSLGRDECKFDYRTSLFKQTQTPTKNPPQVIVSFSMTLQKTSQPKIDYRDLAQYFNKSASPTLSEIREAVMSVRSEKFPDWHQSNIGTAGSYFINPVISREKLILLQAQYSELEWVYYELPDGKVKIPLAFILDKLLQLRGYRSATANGSIRLFEKQPLIIVTEGEVTTTELLAFEDDIRQRVKEATDIMIEREVRSLIE